jgi:hypothetical protein
MRRICTLGFVVALCATASAEMLVFNFPLDGLQEVPPLATPATGTGLVTLDTDTNELTWDIAYQDLIGTLSGAHFHGPAGYGVNAGVVVPLTISASPIVGSTFVTDEVEGYITSGLTYVNLHTSFSGSGEIRGQVVPEPTSLSLLALGGLAVLRRR